MHFKPQKNGGFKLVGLRFFFHKLLYREKTHKQHVK